MTEPKELTREEADAVLVQGHGAICEYRLSSITSVDVEMINGYTGALALYRVKDEFNYFHFLPWYPGYEPKPKHIYFAITSANFNSDVSVIINGTEYRPVEDDDDRH